jgi:3-oxoacyl-[acyl-carrier-protein] synthase II
MIAVTGIGIISPYGVGKEKFLDGARMGSVLDGSMRSGIVRDFIPKEHINPMKVRRMSRFSQLALVSALEAWKDASMQDSYNPDDIGVIVGTGLGSVSSTHDFYTSLLEKGPDEMNPMLFPETVQNIAAAHISIEFGIGGPNTTFSEAGVAGENALFYACSLLNGGIKAVMVTGADELTKPVYDGMNKLKILSKRGAVCPFDRKRDGIILGEGACTLILERTSDALARKGRIYGEILSYGFSSEPVDRLRYASSQSMASAIKMANKGRTPHLVVASANSSVELDFREAKALSETIGPAVPVTALSPLAGYFLSSGVMKTGAAMLFLGEQFIPPIWGLEDPEVPGLNYVRALEKNEAFTALVNGFSHGGSNACIFLRKWNET